MTEIALQLRFTPRPQRPACARFIASPDPAGWLEELTTWDVPLAAVRLYPIPRSRSDNTCAGVLVSWETDDTIHSDQDFLPPLRSQAYGRIAERLFLPVEAELSVALRDADWPLLLGQGTTEYVWHPQMGLVAFEPHDVLSVADLISPHVPGGMDREPPADWGGALPGIIFPNRIGSLRGELPSTANEMLAAGRDGIGVQSTQFSSRPIPSAETLKSWGSTIIGCLMLPVAILSNWMARLLAGGRRNAPATASGTGREISGSFIGLCLVACLVTAIALGGPPGFPTWSGFGAFLAACLMFFAARSLIHFTAVQPAAPAASAISAAPAASSGTSGALGGLAAGLQEQFAKFAKWTAGLLDSRQREIERLKKLLDEDPDEGLKYALPFGGEATRGIAPPSGWLTQRLVDFQLGGLGVSASADVWALPPDTQLELITRYRELAAREVRLGRYRRAAYIYAELLGDLNTAATTLVSGRFYREAAVLYRDKLNRPLDAARCLEEGGLLIEAIPIYRQQKQVEKVGDLYRRLGDDEQADLAYQEAVESALSKRDYLDAARLFQEKLHSSDRALETLDAGWPDTQQAKLCLTQTFALLAKLGQHDAAVDRIRTLRESPLAAPRVVDAVGILATLSSSAPHAETRHVAADTVRIMASRELLSGSEYRQPLTNAVGRLAPEDRLLTRDCQRAVEARLVKKLTTTAPSARRTTTELRLLKTYKLPAGVTWTSATGTDRNFYVVGHNQHSLFVSRGAWNDPQGNVSSVSWNFSGQSSNVLICPSRTERQLLIGHAGQVSFLPCHLPRQFASTDVNPDIEVAQSPGWMPNSISALAVAPGGTVYTFQLAERLLTGFDSQGAPVINETLLIPVDSHTVDGHAIYPMVALDNIVFLGVGPLLIESQSRIRLAVHEMPDVIAGLAISHPNIGRRLAVVCQEAGEFFWSGIKSGRSQRFEIGLSNPHAVILRNRQLVIHGIGGWKIYSTTDDAVHLLHDIPCDAKEESFGILKTDANNQVGLCMTDGHVRVFEVP